MTHEQKIQWMREWCERKGLTLDLEAECGFGRECVGVTADDKFPDYIWHDETTWEREDKNGEVWTPEDAYHKHTCVAVLGRGERAEAQLYEWLKWFDENGFVVERGSKPMDLRMGVIGQLLGRDRYVRLVRPIAAPAFPPQ